MNTNNCPNCGHELVAKDELVMWCDGCETGWEMPHFEVIDRRDRIISEQRYRNTDLSNICSVNTNYIKRMAEQCMNTYKTLEEAYKTKFESAPEHSSEAYQYIWPLALMIKSRINRLECWMKDKSEDLKVCRQQLADESRMHTVEITQQNILIKELQDKLAAAGEKDHEICICAAVKTPSGIFRGHRHGDCFQVMEAAGVKRSGEDIQGFMTSKNRFVNRSTGKDLQDAAGIKSVDSKGYHGMGALFSEDLY